MEYELKACELPSEFRSELYLGLVDPNELFTVHRMTARELLIPSRFDIGFKIDIVEQHLRGAEVDWSSYDEHIRAITLNTFQEPGNPEKTTLEFFHLSFIQLIDSISRGYRYEESLVPCNTIGHPLNGAHRIAICSVLGLDVPVLYINKNNPVNYSSEFFRTAAVSGDGIIQSACCIAKYTRGSVHASVYWPRAELKSIPEKTTSKNLLNLKLRTDTSRLDGLVRSAYHGEPWLEDNDGRNSGVPYKVAQCSGRGATCIVAIDIFENSNQALAYKEEFRLLKGCGKSAVHQTDTLEEALQLLTSLSTFDGELLSNCPHARYSKETWILLAELESIFENLALDKESILIDGSFVMQYLGIRLADDIDLVLVGDNPGAKQLNGLILLEKYKISLRTTDQLAYHSVSPERLVTCSKFYFRHSGLKGLNPSQLIRFKKNRAEQKDLIDVDLLMTRQNKKFGVSRLLARLKKIEFITRLRIKVKILNLLKALGLYVFIQRMRGRL